MGRMLLHHLGRSWKSGVLSCLALFGFQFFICGAFQQVSTSGVSAPLTRLIPKWAQSLFSIDPASMTTFNGFISFSYQHPFLLAVLLGVPIAAATAFLAGDIEQRNMGLLLARPINRLSIIGSSAIVCGLWPALGIGCALLGTYVGSRWIHLAEPIDWHILSRVAFNLYLLILAFCMITLLLSALHDERGDAIGWAVTIALLMYVWNFLAQLWAASGNLPNYSLFRFYQPAAMILRGASPITHLEVLGLVALGSLALASVHFRFRDISV